MLAPCSVRTAGTLDRASGDQGSSPAERGTFMARRSGRGGGHDRRGAGGGRPRRRRRNAADRQPGDSGRAEPGGRADRGVAEHALDGGDLEAPARRATEPLPSDWARSVTHSSPIRAGTDKRHAFPCRSFRACAGTRPPTTDDGRAHLRWARSLRRAASVVSLLASRLGAGVPLGNEDPVGQRQRRSRGTVEHRLDADRPIGHGPHRGGGPRTPSAPG